MRGGGGAEGRKGGWRRDGGGRGKGATLPQGRRGGRLQAGQGGEAHGVAGGVAQVTGAGADMKDLAGVAGDGLEKLLRGELGDQGLADADEGLQLAGLAPEVTQLPEALHDRAGLVGQAHQQREVARAEAMEVVAVEIEDAEHLPARAEQGRGHLAADSRPHPHIARVGRDIRHQLRPAVKGDPAGDALPKPEGDGIQVHGKALVDLDLEAAGVRAEECDRAGAGGKGVGGGGENRAEGLAGIGGAADGGGDAIERAISAWIGLGGGGGNG